MSDTFICGEIPTFLARILNVELVSSDELLEYNDLLLRSDLTDDEITRRTELEAIVDNAVLLPQDVKSMTYSISRTITYGSSGSGEVSHHSNVPITLGTATIPGPFQERLITNDHLWTNDAIGYNFKWSPSIITDNNVEYPPFPSKGFYNVSFVVKLNERLGNPICWNRLVTIV